MELERDIRIVIVAHLDDEKCIESTKNKTMNTKFVLINNLKEIPELYSSDDDDKDSEYINGFQMKCRFIKSNHMVIIY